MKKLKKILIVLSILLVLTVGGVVGYLKIYLPMQTVWELSIKDSDNNIIETIDVKKNSILEIYDSKNNIKEEIVINDEKELTLQNEEDSDSELFINYSVTKKSNVDSKSTYEIKPEYQKKKDFVLSASSDSKSKLKLNGYTYNRRNIPVEKGTTYKKIIPEITIEKDYKGSWVYVSSKKEVILTDVIDKDTEIQFVTYQDKNNNNIDDFTETFTVKYNTTVDEIKINEVAVGWEETVKLPTLKHDTKVFYEWYTDSTMKVIMTEDTKITSNMTLYAKFKDINQVMNESVETPIVRKSLALQIERIINDYNEGVDKRYNELITKENTDREKREQYEKENNIFNAERVYSTEFSNTALNKLYFVTFIDQNSEFIYGFVAPYGRTIKVYDSKNNLYKEYAVRQHTTITLSDEELISYNEELVEYTSEYYKINDTIYVKVTPAVKITAVEQSQE